MSSPIRSVRKRKSSTNKVWQGQIKVKNDEVKSKSDEDFLYWLDWKERLEKRCAAACSFCGVNPHPKLWTHRIILNVHDYNFLQDCRDLDISKASVIGSNSSKTMVVINVPMMDGHPWKTKAEQVIKYTDVELGIGDRSAYNEFHYRQPCDRKIFLIISSEKVVGLLVAEKLSEARRILKETTFYRDVGGKIVKVRVGINRMWIHVSMRRRGFATQLIKIVGQRFFEGDMLQKSDYAFNSSLSNAGIAVAKVFLQTHRVPVYKGKTGIEN